MNAEIAAEFEQDAVIAKTRHWLERAVVGLNLCPFAKAVHVKDQIAYRVSVARDEDALLADLQGALRELQDTDPGTIDTLLLIHPLVLVEFEDYNQFLDLADATLEALELDGEIQIASFHPQYCFADAEPEAMENYTNRSPYPMLHLLREASVERAVAAFPDPDAIYLRNIEVLRRLGPEGWRELFL